MLELTCFYTETVSVLDCGNAMRDRLANDSVDDLF
jgi:hypothetical protein